MLAQRRRRWANIEPALVHCFVFVGIDLIPRQTTDLRPMLGYCWVDVANGGPTFTRHWVSYSCLLLSESLLGQWSPLSLATVHTGDPLGTTGAKIT